MTYGIEVFDSSGIKTLGMEDFTIQRLATFIHPAEKSSGEGTRADYTTYTVAGYDPGNCFVIITPRVYANYPQPGYADGWGYTPVYIDLGGNSFGIITYQNYLYYTGISNNYKNRWQSNSVESVIEVVKIA